MPGSPWAHNWRKPGNYRLSSKSRKTVIRTETKNEYGDFNGHVTLLGEAVEINREIVLALLKPTCFTVNCAGNGAQAVRRFEEAPEEYDMLCREWTDTMQRVACRCEGYTDQSDDCQRISGRHRKML